MNIARRSAAICLFWRLLPAICNERSFAPLINRPRLIGVVSAAVHYTFAYSRGRGGRRRRRRRWWRRNNNSRALCLLRLAHYWEYSVTVSLSYTGREAGHVMPVSSLLFLPSTVARRYVSSSSSLLLRPFLLLLRSLMWRLHAQRSSCSRSQDERAPLAHASLSPLLSSFARSLAVSRLLYLINAPAHARASCEIEPRLVLPRSLARVNRSRYRKNSVRMSSSRCLTSPIGIRARTCRSWAP